MFDLVNGKGMEGVYIVIMGLVFVWFDLEYGNGIFVYNDIVVEIEYDLCKDLDRLGV